jgi:putative tryptophan/tyrosine transport system substrate-binding protein
VLPNGSYRWAENNLDRLPDLAADLVRRRVAVIVSVAPSAAFAAKPATTTIPIVFNVGEDPVRLGLVASLARPSGNLTGVNFATLELATKRLELLLQLMPEAVHIAVLVNPAAATTAETTLSDASVAAHAMGLKIQIVRANTNREIESAFEDFARERGFPRHIPFVILPKRVA